MSGPGVLDDVGDRLLSDPEDDQVPVGVGAQVRGDVQFDGDAGEVPGILDGRFQGGSDAQVGERARAEAPRNGADLIECGPGGIGDVFDSGRNSCGNSSVFIRSLISRNVIV